MNVLLRMLPSYYKQVSMFKNSLITKFCGVHCVKPIGAPKTRFVVMSNLFCSEYHIHRRFDLKEIDEVMTLKDLDLNYAFRLHRSWYLELLEQIKWDCEFLEAEGIMDYSLLLGIHFCDDISPSWTALSPCSPSPKAYRKSGSFQDLVAWSDLQFSNSSHQNMDTTRDDWKSLLQLGINMPARAERMTTSGSMSIHNDYIHNVILYFGIIDILQDYDISKKLEHAYKSLQVDPNSISSVDPKLYSRRFQDFIRRIFIEDD